ncbi:MAG: flippase [Archaeoglobaceae archaeon]
MLARTVLRNVIYNSASILVANLAGLFLSIYVARILTPGPFGIYSLSLSLAFLLMSFTDLGVNATVVRYVAHAHSTGDLELARGYIRSLAAVKIALALTASLFLALASDTIATVFQKPLSVPLKIMAAYVFLFSLAGFVNSIFNAFNDFKANLVKSTVYEASRVFFVLLFLFLGFSVVGALFGYVVASFAALSALLLLLRKYSSVITGNAKGVDWRRVLRFTGYLTIGSISWTIFAYVDSVMIGLLLPATDVGFYRAAYNVVAAVAALVSIPTVLFPVFVQLEGEDLKRAFDRVVKYSSILAFPSAFGLAAISEQLVSFVYGAEYLPASVPLAILSLLILRSALGFWGTLFTAKEMPKYPVYATIFGMLVNVVLNYVLILRVGIAGAAAATVISNVIVWLLLARASAKILGVSVKAGSLLKPLAASVLTVCVVLVVGFNSLLDAIVKLLICAALYFAVLYFLKGLDKEDIEYVRRFM